MPTRKISSEKPDKKDYGNPTPSPAVQHKSQRRDKKKRDKKKSGHRNKQIVLDYRIESQPDDVSCGPTCLHSVYRHFGESIGLDQVITEVHSLEDGGTLAVFLACHALRRGYKARIYTYNLHVFDPTWFDPALQVNLIEKLGQQAQVKASKKLQSATRAYRDYLRLGGEVCFSNLTPPLLKSLFNLGGPILTGLSSTYLYSCAREIDDGERITAYDDVKGTPQGHFVVLTGYDKVKKRALIADPYADNPLKRSNYYSVPVMRLINAILLGIVTYDANLLILQPGK